MDNLAERQRPQLDQVTASPHMASYVVRSPFMAMLLAFIALGILARMIGLSINSYWLDELASVVHFAKPEVPLGYLFTEMLPTDNTPPLYYLALYFWSSLFGQSEVATRSLSVLFGLAALLTPFILRGPSASLRRKLLLSALLACTYAAIYYSQEARCYSLVILLSGLATFTAVNIDSAIARSEKVTSSELLRLVLFSVLVAYTHYFGFLLLCSLFAILGARALLVRNTAMFWKAAAYGLVGVLLFVPWVLFSRYKQEEFISAFGNDPIVIAKNVVIFGYYLTGSALAALICGVLIVGYAGLTVFHFLRVRRRAGGGGWHILTQQHNVPIVIFAMIFVLSVIVSVVVSPIINYRNYFVALPAFLLYVAFSWEFFLKLSPLLRRNMVSAVAVFLAILLFGSLYDHYQPHKEHWRQSAAYIESIDGCSAAEIVVLGSRERWKGLYEFYLSGANVRVIPVVYDGSGHVTTAGARETVQRIWQQPCPAKIWAAHIHEDELRAMLEELEIPQDARITPFTKAFVVERQRPT